MPLAIFIGILIFLRLVLEFLMYLQDIKRYKRAMKNYEATKHRRSKPPKKPKFLQ